MLILPRRCSYLFGFFLSLFLYIIQAFKLDHWMDRIVVEISLGEKGDKVWA